MRARLAASLCLVLALTALAPLGAASAASGARKGTVLAQEEESERQGGGGGEPAQETGAGEGETEGGGAETGPPWTYQMARISLLLLAAMLGGIGWVYFKLVVRRRRGEA